MKTVILAFHDDDDDCVEFRAVVDTLDPICALIDNDEEPPVPEFPGCTLHDTSYGSRSGTHEFVIDYGLDEGQVDPVQVEAALRAFLAQHYPIKVLDFGELPPEEDPEPAAPPCRGPLPR